MVTRKINDDITLAYLLNKTLERAYPVGSIYMSMNQTDPGTLFGGKWEQIQNTFLLAAGSSYAAGSTGGEATHALTVNEMPSHNHKAGHLNNSILTSPGGSQWPPLLISPDGNIEVYNMNTSSTGGGAAHNNMPPYLTVYMWQRVA